MASAVTPSAFLERLAKTSEFNAVELTEKLRLISDN
jgi:hypothetical protein